MKFQKDYRELVKQNLDQNLITSKQIKFDNDILHRSKVLKHFLDNNEEISRTEKDFKTVYKKIKKNKKYFLSIKDIIVLESLKYDGVSLPNDLRFWQHFFSTNNPSKFGRSRKPKSNRFSHA